MLLSITYIIGITAEAMTAALAAGRQRFDLFGVLVLACVTAFGGGVVRDLLLDHYPLIWVENPVYLVIVLVALVGAIATLGSYLAAVDTAGAAARSVAIGLEFEPTRGTIATSEAGGLMTVTATIPAPLGEVSATAVFPQEAP